MSYKGYRVVLVIEHIEDSSPVSDKTRRVLHIVDHPRLKIIESVEDPKAFAEAVAIHLESALRAPTDAALEELYHTLGEMINNRLKVRP